MAGAAAAAADPLVQLLEAGQPVPNGHLYSKSSRGVWMRRTALGRVEAWEKYCCTCNIW